MQCGYTLVCSVQQPLGWTGYSTLYNINSRGTWVSACVWPRRTGKQGARRSKKIYHLSHANAEVSVHLVAILAVRGATPLVLRLERVRTKPRLIGKIHPLRREDAGHHRVVGGLGALVPLLRVDEVLPAHA